jgi:hypothetical protein
MPASLTHHLFARQSIERIGAQLPFVMGNERVVSVGAQGPDPFYFYGYLPWKKRSDKAAVNDIGTLFHAGDPVDTIPALISGLALFEGEEKRIAAAYVYGFLMHYVLDRQLHPYVFFHSGFDMDKGFAFPYNADHARFEACLDTAMMAHFQVSFSELPPGPSLELSNKQLEVLDDLFADWKDGVCNDHRFSKSLSDMKSVLSAVFGKFGGRRKLIKKLAGERSMMFAMAHPPVIPKDEAYDYLNEARRPWRDPATGTITHDTVLERFEIAQKDMAPIASLLLACYEGKEVSEAEWNAIFRHIDFDGKRVGTKQRHFQSIYPAYPGTPGSAGDPL